MYMMFLAPAFRHRVDQISWAGAHGGVDASAHVTPGGGRGCNVTQRCCGQCTSSAGSAEVAHGLRVAALRHLFSMCICGAHFGFAPGRRALAPCVCVCVPARQ